VVTGRGMACLCDGISLFIKNKIKKNIFLLSMNKEIYIFVVEKRQRKWKFSPENTMPILSILG
jgi:hypothetical protein